MKQVFAAIPELALTMTKRGYVRRCDLVRTEDIPLLQLGPGGPFLPSDPRGSAGAGGGDDSSTPSSASAADGGGVASGADSPTEPSSSSSSSSSSAASSRRCVMGADWIPDVGRIVHNSITMNTDP